MARCSTSWPKRSSGHVVEGGCGQNVGYARCYPTANLVPRVLSLRPAQWPTAGQFFLKRWLIITENVRKQRASSICHIYHSLPSHKFSKQTRDRSETEKLECRINRSFGQLSYERAIIISTSQVVKSIPCRLGHSFCHLIKPLLPCVDRRILGREVCKIHSYNQFYGNKHNLL